MIFDRKTSLSSTTVKSQLLFIHLNRVQLSMPTMTQRFPKMTGRVSEWFVTALRWRIQWKLVDLDWGSSPSFTWQVLNLPGNYFLDHQLHGNLHQLTENNCSGFMNGKIICSSFDMSHTFFLSYFVVSLVGLSVRGRGGGLGKACERIWKPRSMFFLTPNLFAKKREKKRMYSYFDDVTIIMSRQREFYQ